MMVALFAIGIAGLFYLDRDRARTSPALWIPVAWLMIVSSRPVSAWLNLRPPDPREMLLDGSPVDRLVFTGLLAAGVVVLLRRNNWVQPFVRAKWPIVFYFVLCLLSVVWSDYSGVALKRWTKAIGDLVMVLIVVTDPRPALALRRFLSYAGFILLPASVLLIKYFDYLGRGYDGFTGAPINTGVTTNKNSLGVITLVLALGAAWRVITLLRAKGQPDRFRHLLAQGTLLAFGLTVLKQANSATSTATFALGSGLLMVTNLPQVRRRPAAVHALIVSIIVFGGFAILLSGDEAIVNAMGRSTDLTGRTAIWEAVIPMAPNPVFGAGFESFWLGQRLDEMWQKFPVFRPNEAHNGYIEVYLNLGFAGLFFIVLIFAMGYKHATALFRSDPEVGALMLAFMATAAVYSVTEAGFRLLNPNWICLLLAVCYFGDRQRVAPHRLGDHRSVMAAKAARLTPMALGTPRPLSDVTAQNLRSTSTWDH